MTKRIKILFLGAHSPQGSRDWFPEEVREIEKRMQYGGARDAFELISHLAVRTSDLQRILLQQEPHIVHFSGRGIKNQGIILENDAGQAQPISESTFAALFGILKGNIRVIVLNACYANRQAAPLSKIFDYVIGINRSVESDTDVTFSGFFYQALAFGRTVKEAFELAITQLMMERVEEYKKPFLKMRAGVDPLKSLQKQIENEGPPLKALGGWPFPPISAALRKRCRELFGICDEFNSPDRLRDFFAINELRPFAHCVDRSSRLDFDQLISCLHRSGLKRPALFDLLEMLEFHYEGDLREEACEGLKNDYAMEMQID